VAQKTEIINNGVPLCTKLTCMVEAVAFVDFYNVGWEIFIRDRS
jgi:hypothetical protein